MYEVRTYKFYEFGLFFLYVFLYGPFVYVKKDSMDYRKNKLPIGNIKVNLLKYRSLIIMLEIANGVDVSCIYVG